MQPLVVERMGGDPAVTSSPILATLTDVIGVLVLCVISSKMLAVTSEF
jgi:Mg/Co/Ni transporter MgtE